jgi:hypothetical protein
MYCLRPRSNVKAPDWIVGLFWPALMRACPTAPPVVYGLSGALGTVKVLADDVDP